MRNFPLPSEGSIAKFYFFRKGRAGFYMKNKFLICLKSTNFHTILGFLLKKCINNGKLKKADKLRTQGKSDIVWREGV